jgi:hypothetical protein
MTRVRHDRTGGHGFKSRHTVPDANRIGSAKKVRDVGEKGPTPLARVSVPTSLSSHDKSVTLASSGSAFRGVLGRRRRSTTLTMREHTTTTRSNSCINPLTWSRWSTPPGFDWTTKNRKTAAGFLRGGPMVQCKCTIVAQKTGRRAPHTPDIVYPLIIRSLHLHWTIGPPPRRGRRSTAVSGGPMAHGGEWTTWTTLSEVTR